MRMEENDNISSPYKIGNDNGFEYTGGVDTSIKIPDRSKVKYNLSIPWLNLGANVVFCVNDNIKWYTILMLKVLRCKLEDATTNDKLDIPPVPLNQKIYNKLNNALKKLLNV